jgi:hypothetical protein
LHLLPFLFKNQISTQKILSLNTFSFFAPTSSFFTAERTGTLFFPFEKENLHNPQHGGSTAEMDDSLRELEDELGRMGEETTFEQPPATASDAPTPVEKTVSTEDVSAERRSEPGSSEAAPIPVSPSPGSQTDLHSSSGSLGTSPGEGERVRRLPSFANRKKASGNADTVEKGGTFGRKMARSIIGGKLGKSCKLSRRPFPRVKLV